MDVDSSETLPIMAYQDGAKPYKCNLCHESFSLFGSLQCHLKTHNNETNCIDTDKNILIQQTVDQETPAHNRRKSGAPKKRKPKLEIEPSTSGDYNEADASNERKQKMAKVEDTCSECGKQFKGRVRSYLKVHMRVHTGEKPFACEFCDSSFAQRSMLTLHIKRWHVDKKAYQCNLCNEEFSEYRVMEYHLQTFHENQKQYQCKVCLKEFKLLGNYEVHMKLHDGNTLKCEGCERVFTRERDLETHQGACQLLLEPGCFKCDICSKQYDKRAQLSRHLKTHKKPYFCDICGKEFGDISNMKRHFKCRHENDGKSIPNQTKCAPTILCSGAYKCDVCEKYFQEKRQLMRHLKTHEKPYSCNFCSLNLGDITNMKRHVMQKHNNEMLQVKTEPLESAEPLGSDESLESAEPLGSDELLGSDESEDIVHSATMVKVESSDVEDDRITYRIEVVAED